MESIKYRPSYTKQSATSYLYILIWANSTVDWTQLNLLLKQFDLLGLDIIIPTTRTAYDYVEWP